jgi:alcohol sulfotransferase
MRVRESDKPVSGFICSHPKSGRTWMRFALARYLTRVYGIDVDVSLQTMWTILPNYDGGNQVDGRDLRTYEYGDRDDVPLVLSSHLDFDRKLFGDAPVAFIIRSPYDVTVSNYFQKSKVERTFHGTMPEFVRDPDVGIKNNVRYWNTWSEQLLSNGDLTMSYEALRAEPVELFRQMAVHVGLEDDPEAAAEAIRYASIENMRKIELREGIINLDYDQSDPEALRVRRAKIGGYGDYLTADDVEFIHDVCERELTPATKRLLAEHDVEY